MTVTIDSVNDLGGGRYLLEWSTDESDPLFYIYINGELYTTTYEISTVIQVELNESNTIQILDTSSTTGLTKTFRNRFEIGWLATDDTDYYKVEEYYDSEWTERARIPDDGSTFYLWRSRVLEDSTTHEFRVTPVGESGNNGTVRYYHGVMARRPDVPNVTATYDSDTGKITIADNS